MPIGFTANFFSNPFTELYVNNNGNVTFSGPQFQYTPFDFTTSGDVMIAPFLADVDTQGAPGDGSSEVTYGQTSVGGADAFCVNWVNVGYFFTSVDKKNSFQLLLIDRGGGDFDIEFNYDKIQWEAGSASGGEGGLGGVPAAVGFANGDGDPTHSFVREGSFEVGALLDGGPRSLIADSIGSGQLGRYVFEVRSAPPTGATLTGEVRDPFATPVGRAAVEICRVGGNCIARVADSSGVYRAVNLPAGSYDVTAHSAAGGTEYADGHAGPIALSGTSTFMQDVVLGDPLTGPPPGTTITHIGESSAGIPAVLWSEPLVLVTEGCANGKASYEVTVAGALVRSGPLTESPSGSGFYQGTIAPLQPYSGGAQVHIEIADCAEPSEVDFAIYIDPSGVVRDLHTGAPIAGATVTLFRSADADGPFILVPEGSVTMSPGNRTNPDFTDAAGRFGWDVIAGYYKVEASMPGCSTAITGVLQIPPPVTDLDIGLDCGNAPPPESGGRSAAGRGTGPGVVGGSTTVTPAKGFALVGRVARVRRGRAFLRIRCRGTGPCAGVAKLFARVRNRNRARRSARTRLALVGRSRYRVPVGKVRVVGVRLNRRGRALLRRAGRRGLKTKVAGRNLRNRVVRLKQVRRQSRRGSPSMRARSKLQSAKYGDGHAVGAWPSPRVGGP